MKSRALLKGAKAHHIIHYGKYIIKGAEVKNKKQVKSLWSKLTGKVSLPEVPKISIPTNEILFEKKT
jgi:hypothetical protein